MRTYNAGTHLGLLLTRVALGAYLLLAGWGKVTTELDKGIGYFYKENFQGMTPDWLPGWFGTPYGYALPWLELLVGGLVALGLFTRFFATGGFLMLVSFTIALAIKFENITAQPEGPGGPFNANYIQATMYLLLIFTGAGALSLDRVFFGKRKPKAEPKS